MTSFGNKSDRSEREMRVDQMIFRAWSLLLCFSFALSACGAQPAGELPATPGTMPPGLLGQTGHTPTPSAEIPPVHPLTLPPSPDLAATASAMPTATPVKYIVQKGDTLLGLATEWGVPMAAIQKLNRMGDSTVVRVGMPLLIPSRAGWEGASRFWVLHVVKEGETLSLIAQRYKLTVAQLVEVNHLSDADHIVVGQELIIPLSGPVPEVPAPTRTPRPRAPTPRPVQTPTPQALGAEQATPQSSVAAPDLPATLSTDIADWPYETVRIINEIRAQHGLPPYTYNETLAVAAQAHAEDCSRRGWCSHTGSDGSDVKTRVRRAGYTGVGWAECWAQRLDPRAAVEIWMAETPPNDPHRRMMLHTWFTEVGVGIAKATWGYYFVADFGRP